MSICQQMYVNISKNVYIYIYIVDSCIIRRPLDRGATRLRRLVVWSCVLYPLHPCILRPVSFASLHPASMSACCMLHACFLYLGCCLHQSGWWSSTQNSHFTTAGAHHLDPGVLVARQPAAIYSMYVSMMHLQHLCSHMQPYVHPFSCFLDAQGPSRTPKNHENHCTVIQIQCFANLKKIPFWDRLCMPSGPLWGPFWSPLRSLGLLLALPGLPKRFKNSKKMNKMRSWTSLGAPRVKKDAKDIPGPPKCTLKTTKKYEK